MARPRKENAAELQPSMSGSTSRQPSGRRSVAHRQGRRVDREPILTDMTDCDRYEPKKDA